MRMLLLFLLFFSSLRADWDQLFSQDEDPSLFHHVNVISGNLNLCLEDTVIEGAKRLPIFRTYSSSGALENPQLNDDLKEERGGWIVQGGWNFIPHANLWIDLKSKVKEFRFYLPEPGGNLIPYSYSHNTSDHHFIFKPQKEFRQCSGSLSAKTNPGNNVLDLDTKDGIAVLHLPNGGSRIYQGEEFRHWNIRDLRGRVNRRRLKSCYRLVKEILPSQHRITYHYDDHDRLENVSLKNPSETKTFSWMHLKGSKKKSPFQLRIDTSDGKAFQYNSTRHQEVDYITSVNSNNRPEEGIALIPGRKKIGARIKRMDMGGKCQFEAKYYTPPDKEKEKKWAKHPEKKHFDTDKVESLEAPIGPNGETMTLARFTYQPGVTDARDSSNRLTRYIHDAGHLNSIEYFNEKDELISILQFIWEKERLKAKLMMNGCRHAYFSKVFDYDDAGNVRQETLWGSLTGNVPAPFNPNSDGSLAHAEHYSKRYDYLPGFNIPIREEEENGLVYLYTYKNGTDLPTTKFTSYHDKILVREFLFYNDDNLLVAEITDDGISTDPNDLNGVTERHIKRYELQEPSGLIHSLTEKYLDNASHTEKLLRQTVYSYHPTHRVAKEAIFDSNGTHRYTIEIDYDPQGRVTRQTTPVGKVNTYSHDSLGNLRFAKEVSQPAKTFEYDPAGRPKYVQESDEKGIIKTTFTNYDAHGNLKSQIDSKGNRTEQSYDAFGRCVKTQFPATWDKEGNPYSPVVNFAYDIQGNLSSSSVSEAGTTQTLYNTLRKPVQIIHPDGTVLSHRYNKEGTLAKTIHPDGTHADYVYDMFQRVASKTITSAEGNLLSNEIWTYNSFHLLSYTDPNGLTTTYTYDAAGRKTTEQAEDQLITYTYDPLGFLEKTTQSDVTHVQIHDVAGKITEEWNEFSDGRIENHMWFFYDNEERKCKAERLTSQGIATDRFIYNPESQLIAHVDPEQNPTYWSYDDTETNALGQRVLEKRMTDALGNSTIETHDALNHVINRTQQDFFGNTVSKEDFFYDKAGNLARRVSTIYHDHTPTSQISVWWEYDPMGRVILEKEGSDKTTRFIYDDKRRAVRCVLPNGVAIDSTYDGIDRLIEKKSSDGTIHYQYTYENGSRDPVQISDLVQHTLLQRKYNAFGQIIQEINPYGLTFTWEYDHHGRCSSFTLPDLSYITYSYQAGHLSEVSKFSPEGKTLFTHRYLEFDPNGHVAQEELIHDLGIQHSIRDLLERPRSQHSHWLNQRISFGLSGLVTETHHSLLGDKTYKHDPLNQLIQEGEEQYRFDSLGNPIDCSINEYNQILSASNYKLEYDLNGNPFQKTSSEGTTIYTYDALNRLTSVTSPDSKKRVYFYDAFSRLIAEQSDGVQTFYLYDKNQEIGAMNGSGTITQLKVIGLGVIGGSIAIELEGVAYAPLHDFQGNIVALISQDHNIAESYQFNAFGRETSDSIPLNPWRFSSKRSMDGLIFFGQRFYDPTLGRWLTPDPSGFADGSNLYVYVLNSPMNRLDLFGLFSDPLFPEFRIEVPISAFSPGKIIPLGTLLPCKAIIDGVSTDSFITCGYFHKLQFTPQEWHTGIVNIVDHFHELVPERGQMIGLITAQNGIQTNLSEFSKNVQSIVNMVPEGTLIMGIYNPTQGIYRDCKRTIEERRGKDTPIVVSTRQMMVAISQALYKINPELAWLHVAHSEGGVICKNAIQGMIEDERGLLKKQMYILALGPAEPIPKDYGRGVTNIYSEKDFITGRFAKKHVDDPNYDIQFVECRSTWSERTGYFADHAHLGGTYQWAQFKNIDNLRQERGFHRATR